MLVKTATDKFIANSDMAWQCHDNFKLLSTDLVFKLSRGFGSGAQKKLLKIKICRGKLTDCQDMIVDDGTDTSVG